MRGAFKGDDGLLKCEDGGQEEKRGREKGKGKRKGEEKRVAVGMPVTRHPPHRSVREELPHTAPALGNDAQTLRRIRMAYPRDGNAPGNQAIHPVPGEAVLVAAALEHLEPQPIHLLSDSRKAPMAWLFMGTP